MVGDDADVAEVEGGHASGHDTRPCGRLVPGDGRKSQGCESVAEEETPSETVRTGEIGTLCGDLILVKDAVVAFERATLYIHGTSVGTDTVLCDQDAAPSGAGGLEVDTATSRGSPPRHDGVDDVDVGMDGGDVGPIPWSDIPEEEDIVDVEGAVDSSEARTADETDLGEDETAAGEGDGDVQEVHVEEGQVGFRDDKNGVGEGRGTTLSAVESDVDEGVEEEGVTGEIEGAWDVEVTSGP